MYHPPMSDLLIPLLIALVLVILWRGPKTLPKLGAALGRGVREAKTEAARAQDEIKARVGDGGDAGGPSGDGGDPRA